MQRIKDERQCAQVRHKGGLFVDDKATAIKDERGRIYSHSTIGPA